MIVKLNEPNKKGTKVTALLSSIVRFKLGIYTTNFRFIFAFPMQQVLKMLTGWSG